MRPRLKMRLGDLLVHEHIISEQQLNDALQDQKQNGRKLGATLIELGMIEETQLLRFLAQQLNVAFVNLDNETLDPKVVKLIPEVYARRFRALALADLGDAIQVAMSDPADLSSLDQLAPIVAPKQIEIVVAQEKQILAAFDNLYRRTQDIESFASQLQEEYQETEEFDLNAIDENTSDATVV